MDFDLLSVIGRGSYAKVLLVRLKKTERIYAMKVVKKELVNDDEVLNTHTHTGTCKHTLIPVNTRTHTHNDNRKHTHTHTLVHLNTRAHTHLCM